MSTKCTLLEQSHPNGLSYLHLYYDIQSREIALVIGESITYILAEGYRAEAIWTAVENEREWWNQR